jgi:hypothetical protein
MSLRVQNIAAGLGDGEAAATLSAEDAASVGLEAGVYTGKQMLKALAAPAPKAPAAPAPKAPAAPAAPAGKK